MRTTSSVLFVVASALLSSACSEKTVELSGRIYSGVEQADVAGGAQLEIVSFEDEALAETVADADGYFYVDVPMDVNVFLRIEHEGEPTTTFAGVVSLFDEVLPDGYLYTVPERDVDAMEGLFDGCAAGSGPGVVAGQVRHQDLTERDGSFAINTGAQAKLLLEDGGELLACYLDDAGEAYDPQALLTGDSGRFAFFGVPAGTHTLEVGYDASLQLRQVEYYPVLVLEQSSVSPWFPAWVTMPL